MSTILRKSKVCLKRCLDSLSQQTLKDIQVICVDDASTDNSSLILKEHARRDSRFFLLSLDQNYGPGHARNAAMQYVEGQISFYFIVPFTRSLVLDYWWNLSCNKYIAFMAFLEPLYRCEFSNPKFCQKEKPWLNFQFL